MQWYYSKNGSQLGPVEQGELLAKISSGEVAPSDMCWREGMGDWLPVSKVSELAMSARPAPSATPDASVPGPMVNSPYTPPVATGVPYTPPAGSGKATAAMVLGIVGLVFGICGCYGIVISLPCGILAIVFGSQVKNEAITNPALQSELGKAKAGVIMGWIGLGISVLLTILLISLGVASTIFGEMSR